MNPVAKKIPSGERRKFGDLDLTDARRGRKINLFLSEIIYSAKYILIRTAAKLSFSSLFAATNASGSHSPQSPGLVLSERFINY